MANIKFNARHGISVGNTPVDLVDTTGAMTPASINAGTGAITGGALSGTSISSSGVITSTLATGTSPFSISSTTVVPNLNVSQLLGYTWAVPGSIGATTPNAGAFTTISSSGLASLNSISLTTDLAITHGGTGASDVATAQTNLQVDPAGTALALAIALG